MQIHCVRILVVMAVLFGVMPSANAALRLYATASAGQSFFGESEFERPNYVSAAGGMHFGKIGALWNAEIGVTHLGNFQNKNARTAEIKLNAVEATLVGHVPLSPILTFFFDAGGVLWSASRSDTLKTMYTEKFQDDSGVGYRAGLGLTLATTHQLSLEMSARYYGELADTTNVAVSMGVIYRFYKK